MQPSLVKLTLIPICRVWNVLGKSWCGWNTQRSVWYRLLYFLFWERQKCDNSLTKMTVEGRIFPWNKPTECFLPWTINRFFPGPNDKEVSFFLKLKSSASIVIFYLSSNILVNWTRYLWRSHRKLVSGLEQKLGCSLTINSKWGTECIPKTNMNGFRNTLTRNQFSWSQCFSLPSSGSSLLSPDFHREDLSCSVCLLFLTCCAVLSSLSNIILYLPSHETAFLIFKWCLWKVKTWI